jgi:hypothetical protein
MPQSMSYTFACGMSPEQFTRMVADEEFQLQVSGHLA